jgi:mRNA interferase MazF
LKAAISYGSLYTADLNPRQGTEAGKLRPVLVMQTNLLNQVDHLSTFVLPCTTKLTGGSILGVELPKGIAGNTSDCEIMIDQGRAIDNARFRRRLGALSRGLLAEVQRKLRQLLEL